MPNSTRARPSSPEQLRPSNADIFLLLLNNTSRSYRRDFERQVNRRSRTIAHRFDPDLILSADQREMTHRSEVVFMRTASQVIAPFTLFTVPLTEQMSSLVLVEVSMSTNVCFLIIAHFSGRTVRSARVCTNSSVISTPTPITASFPTIN